MDALSSAVAIIATSPLLVIALFLIPSVWFWKSRRNRPLYDPQRDEKEGVGALNHGKPFRRMSVGSASMAEGQLPEPIPNTVIQSLMWFEGDAPSLSAIKEPLAAIVDKHFRYRAIPVRNTDTGELVWAEVHVDIDSHVFESTAASEAAIQDYVESRCTQRFDRKKPLWDVHILRNTGQGRSLVVWRIEHSVGDGVSLMVVAAEAFRDLNGAPVAHVIPPKRAWTPPGMTLWQRVVYALQYVWTSFLVIYKTQVLTDSPTVLKVGLYPDYEYYDVRKYVQVPPLSMDYLQGIRKILWERGIRVTINDLMFEIFTSTVRRYLAHRSDPLFMDPLSRKSLRVRLWMPYMFPREFEPDDMLHNFWSMVSGEMPVFVDDPVARLLRSKGRMDEIKDTNQALFMRLVQGWSIDLVGYFAMRFIAARATTAHTVLWTNVPGFAHKVTLGGQVVQDIQVVLPTSLTTVATHSYDKHLNVTWTVDPNLVKDRKLLGEMVVDSVKELGNALGVQGDAVWKEGMEKAHGHVVQEAQAA